MAASYFLCNCIGQVQANHGIPVSVSPWRVRCPGPAFAIIVTMAHQKKNKLIIICGLPGSGKSTLAKKLAEETPAIRMCPDEWMLDFGITLWDGSFRHKLEVRLWKLAQELLALGESVILEYGFWGKSERDEKLHAARTLGVGVELHYLDIPIAVLQDRLEKRGTEGDDVLVGKVGEYSTQFERPSEDELKQYDNFTRV